MVDYHDHYLNKNVSNESIKFYKIDPSHYFSSLGLSWDAMLKLDWIKLELFWNIDQHLFIEKGLRGRISSICKRFSETNNKYMKNYDTTKESKTNINLNENKLCGMSQYLPYCKF